MWTKLSAAPRERWKRTSSGASARRSSRWLWSSPGGSGTWATSSSPTSRSSRRSASHAARQNSTPRARSPSASGPTRSSWSRIRGRSPVVQPAMPATRGGRLGRQVPAGLDQVEPPVPSDHLVVGQVVVDVREVDVEDLVPEERERLEGVQRVHRDDAHEFPVRGDRVHRPIERGQGVVPEQEPEARVVAGPPLLVEGPEPVEPERRALARAHADLEGEDLRRELAPLLEIAQERPEVGDRVRHRFGAPGVRLPAGQRFLEPAAGGGFPVTHTLPEEPVEPPDHAVPDRHPRLEGHSAHRHFLERLRGSTEGPSERVGERGGLDPTEVHRELGESQGSAGPIGGPPDENGLAEVRLVLDPVQVDSQARHQARLDGPVGDQAEQRPDDVRAPLGENGLLRTAWRDVIDVEDHRTSSVEEPGADGQG